MYKSQSRSNEIPIDMTEQTNLIFNEMAITFAMRGEYSKAIALYNKIISAEIKINRAGLVPIDFHYFVNRGDCYRYIHIIYITYAICI